MKPRNRQLEIGKSEIGNPRHLARFSLHNCVFLYVLHKKHQDIGSDVDEERWGIGYS